MKRFEGGFRLAVEVPFQSGLGTYLVHLHPEDPAIGNGRPWALPKMRAGGYFVMGYEGEPKSRFPPAAPTDADGVLRLIEEQWMRRAEPGQRGAAYFLDSIDRSPVLVLLHLDPILLDEELRDTGSEARMSRVGWIDGEVMPLCTFEQGQFALDAMAYYLTGFKSGGAAPTWNQSVAFWALEHAGLGGLIAACVGLAITAVFCWVRFFAWALGIVAAYRGQIDHPRRLFGRLVVASAGSQRAIVQGLEAQRVAAESALAHETAEQARRERLARRETEPTPEPSAELPPPSAEQRRALIEAIEERLSGSDLTDAQRQRTRDEMSVALGQRNPWRTYRMLEHARDQLERATPVLDGDEPRS